MDIKFNELTDSQINILFFDMFSSGETEELNVFFDFFHIIENNILDYMIVALNNEHFESLKFVFDKISISKEHLKSLFELSLSFNCYQKIDFIIDYIIDKSIDFDFFCIDKKFNSYIENYIRKKKFFKNIDKF